MRIDGVSICEEGLTLKVSSSSARAFAEAFTPGDYEIKQHKPKRSLDANGYAWALIGQISNAVNVPSVDVYRNALADIGSKTEVFCVQDKALEDAIAVLMGNHIGRRVETLKSKIPGCTTLVLHYGSSDFNAREMSALIDSLVQDCKSIGIETKPREEIESLLREWDGQKRI